MSSDGDRRENREDKSHKYKRKEKTEKNKTDKKQIIFSYIRDILVSLLLVSIIAVVLYSASGVWPPMVAVKSGSMEPNMQRGDLVFVVEEERYVPENVQSQCNCGIITHNNAKDQTYKKFGNYGDVVVYVPNGDPRNEPVIHRAMRFVEKGEKIKIRDRVFTAEYSGFLTKGDNNRFYDQEGGISKIVKKDWIRGKAKYSIPYLGTVRLLFPFFNYIIFY